jgi:superfamily II DNA or RNA helicase
MEANDRVRLRDDPSRMGTLTTKTLERRSVVRRQVRLDDGQSQYFAEDALELITEVGEDPLDMLGARRLSRPDDLRRTLTHVRLTGRLANVIYSMDTTGTDFYAYQFKPVLKLLHSTSSGILIADEVGLGKTIEAGLIWTELRSRFEYRRLMVICPAILREKWRDELGKRFGVDAKIVGSGDALTGFREAADKGWAAQFAMISSMQGMRPRRGWEDEDEQQSAGASSELARFLRDRQHEDPLIDLLIVDEAHYLRNPETMTAKLGRLVRDVSQHVVLLSATPIHLKNRDLFQLTNLIDADTFDHPKAFDDILSANEPLVRAREAVLRGRISRDELLDSLEGANRHPLLAGSRQLRALINEIPSDEELSTPRGASHVAQRIDTVNLLGHAVTRTRKRDVIEWKVIRDVEALEVELEHPIEREFYDGVTHIVREYCGRADAHEGFLLATPQRQMSSSIPAAFRFWRQRAASIREEGEIDLYEDLGIDDSLSSLPDSGVGPLVAAIIDEVGNLASYELLAKHDSKYKHFLALLRSLLEEYPAEKVVVFSYFRATLDYLRDRLNEDGIPSLCLKGGGDDKDEVIREFQEREGPLVLLSTEVGSEGIDLQFAWVMINYDMPWNPMKVEQRIGRIDRLGQKSPRIIVRNLVCADTIDARIYDRLFKRLNIFETSLGALEPVLGDRIQALAMDLLRRDLTPEEEEEKIDQTRRALENIRQDEEELEQNASTLVAYGDYVLDQIHAAQELSRRITDRDLRVYVTDFFAGHYPGSEFRQDLVDPSDFVVGLSNDAKHDFSDFIRQKKLDARTRLTRNDMRSVSCRFENTAVSGPIGGSEIISQFHPLVRFVSQRIKDRGLQTYPASAARISQSELAGALPAGIYVFAVQLRSLRGLQEIEELCFAAAPLSDGSPLLLEEEAERLVVAAANSGKDWLSAAEDVDLDSVFHVANEKCLGSLEDRYNIRLRDITNENEDRADIQLRMLEKHSKAQRSVLEEVADKHRRRGRQALVKATEGRMNALEGRVDRRRLHIEERRSVQASSREIAVGLVLVEGGE